LRSKGTRIIYFNEEGDILEINLREHGISVLLKGTLTKLKGKMIFTDREQGRKVREIFKASIEHDTALPGRPSELTHFIK